MWNKKPEEEKFEAVKCPVCRTALGRRDIKVIHMAHCEECKATFYWKPGVEKPSVIMDKDAIKVRRYCDKDGCHCR